jgi:hypothetical protein
VLFSEPSERDLDVAHTIRVTPSVYQAYKESIAANRPETFALLGGSLDEPMLITDFHFMPPMRDAHGRFVASGAFVYPDHEQLNYVIDNVLVKKGHYMLGLWHSHPGTMNVPSAGDLDYCSRIIANDDSAGRRWNHFLAPITTFDQNGRDTVTAWVLPKAGQRFEPARFFIEGSEPEQSFRHDPADRAHCRADDPLDLIGRTLDLARDLGRFQSRIEFMQAYRISRGLANAQAIVDAAAYSLISEATVQRRLMIAKSRKR